jgi:hypothetical protein
MEQQFLFDSPSAMQDELFIDALRAKISVGLTPEVKERLEICSFIYGKSSIWTENLLKTWKGTTIYRICLFEKPIRKAKKFSGWVRNSSSVGSKRFGKTKPEPETFEWDNFSEINYFQALTVGEFPGTMGIKLLSLTRPWRSKQ